MTTSPYETTTIYQTSTIFQTTATPPPPETTSGIVTAWIPLTTVAPPPLSACWNESFTNDYDTAFDSVPVAFDPDFGFQIGSTFIGCQPTEVAIWFDYATASSTTGALATVTSIQPVVCPSMWSTARTSTVRNSVQVTCCPNGYTADPNDDHGVQANCASSMTPSQTFAYLDSNQNTITTAFSTSITVAAVAVKGWNSIVEAAATTTTATTAARTSSSLTSSSFSTSSSSTTTTSSHTPILSTTEPPSVSHSSGLHGGAAAGIFVGVFAAVALIGVAIFIFLRRRRQSLSADDISGENTNISDLKSGQYVNVPQNPNHRLSELPTASNTPELYTDYDPYSPPGNDAEIHELQ